MPDEGKRPRDEQPGGRGGGRPGRGGQDRGRGGSQKRGEGSSEGRPRGGRGRGDGGTDGRSTDGRSTGGRRADGGERGRRPGASSRDAGRPRTGDRAGREQPAEKKADAPVLPIDDDVTGRELDEDVRSELGTLSKTAATTVARHLVMAARLLEDDPALAYQHTLEARRKAGRIGVVREAAGAAAYAAGRYAEALAELRAARRITGSAEYLPMMADSERGLGRPRRALDLAADPAVSGLEIDSRIEMLIVAAGARRDLGDVDAAVVTLQIPELRATDDGEWVARLRYAYADLLEAAGRVGEARRWFQRAGDADPFGLTDAADRAAALEGAAPPG